MSTFVNNHLEQQTVKSIGVGFIVLASFVLVKKVFGRKKYKLPPGPRPLPIVGNLLRELIIFLYTSPAMRGIDYQFFSHQ